MRSIMSGRTAIILSLVVGLGACSGGKWFAGGGNDGIVLFPDGRPAEAADPRPLVERVTSLKVRRTPAGALLEVVGLPPRIGYWNGELVPDNDERPVDGVLSYSFRISEPPGPTPAGTPYARRVFVGHMIPNARLAGVRQIRVTGAQNAMVARR